MRPPRALTCRTSRPSQRRALARAAGLGAGWLIDLAVGDPQRGHPVALFGTLASGLEKRLYADSRVAGTVYAGVLVGAVAGGGLLIEKRADGPWSTAAATAASTWVVLGGRSLAREGAVMAQLLQGDDLPGARARLSHLCSRDARDLSPQEVARATVESLAENTSDAVVAPLFWGAMAGVPGLLGYRAANTLDAMVGYRSQRYRQFGWACARLDDLLNLVPARIAAALTVVLAPVVGGSPAAARRAWRRDAPAHPSPNAGPVEAAFAGALGVVLGGANSYEGDVEDRGRLGDGMAVQVGDVARTVRLSQAVGASSAMFAGVAAVVAEALKYAAAGSPGKRVWPTTRSRVREDG
ncbi:cobalamin biosynthesis protein [Gephyromycinifex aptenodytis]|uniref:cobalamin biosynthesis protein n=1 Tax=Gephyromycinifex aptenodytis TaxID=2716227 RepID=UPI001D026357|nr:cobalamin biosynthesis protein [Gephyromycinifex aptenodytis]